MSIKPKRFDAKLFKIEGVRLPVVKIQGTVYELKRGANTSVMFESLAEENGWKGACGKPRGWTLLATIKVSGNDPRSAMWALKKWIGD